MKKSALLIILFAAIIPAYAQTTTDKVGQLIASENYFNALVKEKGIKDAFLKMSDGNTILFRPGPVKATAFLKDDANSDSGSLSWEPTFARVSKSNDWGFTTGPYVYKPVDSSKVAHYGDYLSIWKRNKKGIWKLALDAGIPHKKPKAAPKLVFVNPTSEKFLHQYSNSRLQQREDIVFSSDQLFATILKADNKIAHNEFLSEDVRLLFPGYESIIGKKAASEFWEKQGAKLASTPQKADRAYSGELAFTYGNATLTQKGVAKYYHYVRIWEVQPGFNWNVILELYTPAENPD